MSDQCRRLPAKWPIITAVIPRQVSIEIGQPMVRLALTVLTICKGTAATLIASRMMSLCTALVVPPVEPLLIVVVIGGIGSVRGALVASLLVGLVDTFGKVLLPQVAGMLVYMVMAVVLLYKPEGLFKQ